MTKVRIVIEREDGHLGFRIEHTGIFDHNKLCVDSIGTAGDLKDLKEHIIELLGRVAGNDKKLCEALRIMAHNEDLPPLVRNAAAEEFNRWERVRIPS